MNGGDAPVGADHNHNGGGGDVAFKTPPAGNRRGHVSLPARPSGAVD